MLTNASECSQPDGVFLVVETLPCNATPEKRTETFCVVETQPGAPAASRRNWRWAEPVVGWHRQLKEWAQVSVDIPYSLDAWVEDQVWFNDHPSLRRVS